MNNISWRFSRFSIAVLSDRSNLVLCNSFNGSLACVKASNVNFVLKAVHEGISSSEAQKPILAELIDQGYFVLYDIDEVGRAEIILKKEERLTGAHLIVLPNLTCNFRCQYCYEILSGEIMTTKIISAFIRHIQQAVKDWRWFNISWFGGEPLLSKEIIIDLLRQFCIIADQSETYFRSGITTNGYLLDTKTAEELISLRCKNFQITIDGPPEIHDKRRVLVNGGITYERILYNVLQLKTISEQFKVIIRVNYDSNSLSVLPTWIKSLKNQIGNDTRFVFSFHEIWDSQKSYYPRYQLCSYSQEKDTFDNTCLYSKEDVLNFVKRATPNGNVCYAAKKNNYVLLPGGQVLKCTAVLGEPINRVGQLFEDGKIIFDEEKLKMWENPKMRVESCNTCWYYPACRGISCPLGTLIGELKSPECPIGKFVIPKILKTCF